MISSPIVIKALDPLEVSEEHRNEILVAMIFKLVPGTTDKHDESAHILLKEFPYQTISEERRAYLEAESRKIYHHMLLADYDASIPDFRCLANFHEKQKRLGDTLWMECPLDKQVFIKFRKAQSCGCAHYIRGAAVQCFSCKQFFPCRVCHDDGEMDHEFPRFATAMVSCYYCGAEQPFGQSCRNCGRGFGEYVCDKCRLICGMGSNAKPNFHADCCGMCLVGYRESTRHCERCKSCYNMAQFDTHTCIREHQDCIICLGSLQNTIYGRVALRCGHALHQHCYSTLLSQGNFKCPVCRRFLPVDADRDSVLRWQIKNYARVIPPQEYSDYFVRIKCNDCQREFVQKYHPLYYHCPECNLFNCDQIGDASPTEGPAQYRQFLKTYPNSLRPREPTLEGVKDAITSSFGMEICDVEHFIETELTEATLSFAINALNKFPKTIEEFKALYLTQGLFE